MSMAKYIIPAWEITTEKMEAYRETVARNSDQMFQVHTRIAYSEQRKLKPVDLGLIFWYTPRLYRDRQVHWIKDFVVPLDCLITFYKISCLSAKPTATELIFTTGREQNILLTVDLNELYQASRILEILTNVSNRAHIKVVNTEHLRAEGYLSTMVVYRGGEVINVFVKSEEDKWGGDKIVLVGFITEPLGMNVV